MTATVAHQTVYAGVYPISRRGRRPPPSASSALALVAGLGGLFALEALQGRVARETLVGLEQLFGVLTIVGLVLIGPWLCLLAGRGIARLTRGVPGLLAARRIAADPRATFRAVVGVVLAAMAVTYVGTTVDLLKPPAEPGPREAGLRPAVVSVYTGGVAPEKVAPLLSEHAVPERFGTRGFVVSCAELARVRYVTCPHAPVEESGRIEPGPGAERLPIVSIYIPTDGTLAAENRVRTQAANIVPNAIINSDRDPVDYNLEQYFVDLGRLGSVAGLFVLLAGAVSLTAGMIGGLIERRRPFAVLRASGVRLGELRRVVLLETAATMVFTSLLGVGLGLVLAYAAARRGDVMWTWPDLGTFAIVGSGVLAALLFSMFALPLLNATTRHDAVRYE